jgi:FkbM family methyltransferase
MPTFRPGTDDEAFWNAVYEHDEYRVPAFSPSDIVVDLGASIGAFTAKAHAQGARRIFAFEACPDNIQIAHANVQGLEGVELYHRAVVGDRRPPTLPFPVGNNSLFIQEHDTVEVPTITLMDILKQVGKIRYLKIDIEGSEWEVLYAMPDDAWVNIQEIIGEYHQPSQTYWGLEQNRRRPNYDYLTLQQYLQDRGYFTKFSPPGPPNVMAGAFHAVRL